MEEKAIRNFIEDKNIRNIQFVPLLVELPNNYFEKPEMELRAVIATQAVEMLPVCSCKVNLRYKMEKSTC